MTRHLPYDRAERLGMEICNILLEILLTEVADPRLAGIRITRVSMTKDLRIARVYFHMTDPEDPKRTQALKALKSAGGFFKRQIGREIKLKFMPEMEFFYDEVIDVEERIEGLLKSVASR